MADDSNDETLRTETTPDPRRSQREMSTFKAPAQRFALGAELGRGGMGQVIAARDVSLKRGVAIKKVLSTNEVDLERFDREVRITAELEHPSIVPIHDVGLDDEGRPFYVMRQIRGEPLSTRLASLSTLRARLAVLPSLLSVTDAAAFAHARRILHRDIKPANILLGSFGETLLIDWGLARRFDELEPTTPKAAESLPGGALTVAGYVYGTPGYMAPEQARGEVVDARADVFALGATLFHLLVGRGPFDGMSAGDRMQGAIDETPAPFEQLPDDAPGELRAIVVKAMAIDPEQRYLDAGALAADLRAFLEGQLVGAHTYTVGERARRFVRRNRAAIAVAALAAIALVVLGVVAVLRVIDERSETEVARYRAQIALASANEREERLLVEQASVTAETDAVRAILYLRKLPVGSRYTAHAREVAAKAAARGLPYGDHVHADMVTAIALGPEQRYLASADRNGRVVVREPAERNPRVLAELGGHVTELAWLDASTFVSNAGAGLARFSLPSGSHDLLAREHEIGSFAVAEPADRIRFVDRKTRELFELALATGAVRRLARDVDFVVGRGERIVIAGAGGVRWWTAEREILLTPARPRVELNVAVSPDGTKIAMADIDEVYAWDTAGRELGRWPIKYAVRPIWGPDAPYVMTMRNSIVRLGSEPKEIAIPRVRMIGGVQSAVGTAIALDTGDILLADGVSIRNVKLQMNNAARVEGRLDSTLIAMGSRTGEVLWWDLAKIAPAPLFLGNFAPCTTDAHETYVFVDSLDLIALDRKTRAKRTIARFPPLSFGQCVGATSRGQIVIQLTAYGGKLLDNRSGEVRDVTSGWISFDPANDAVLYSSGHRLMQLDHGVGEPRQLFTAPGNIMSVDHSRRWLAVRIEDGRLFRFDRESKDLLEITQRPGSFAVTDTGEVWYSTSRWLWRWTERGQQPVAEFASPIKELGSESDPLFVLLADETQWIAHGDHRVRQITNAGRLLWIGRRGIAAYDRNDDLVLYAFASGERIARPLPENAITVRLELDERTVVARVGAGYLLTYVDDVPAEPKALATWLEQATNAELDPATQALEWRTTSSPGTPRAP